MTQVSLLLDYLLTYEKVMTTSILSNTEKQVVIKELFAALPHPMHSTHTVGTRDIVAKHLTPPSKDEVPVANTSITSTREDKPVSYGEKNPQKETHQKARPIRR